MKVTCRRQINLGDHLFDYLVNILHQESIGTGDSLQLVISINNHASRNIEMTLTCARKRDQSRHGKDASLSTEILSGQFSLPPESVDFREAEPAASFPT